MRHSRVMCQVLVISMGWLAVTTCWAQTLDWEQLWEKAKQVDFVKEPVIVVTDPVVKWALNVPWDWQIQLRRGVSGMDFIGCDVTEDGTPRCALYFVAAGVPASNDAEMLALTLQTLGTMVGNVRLLGQEYVPFQLSGADQNRLLVAVYEATYGLHSLKGIILLTCQPLPMELPGGLRGNAVVLAFHCPHQQIDAKAPYLLACAGTLRSGFSENNLAAMLSHIRFPAVLWANYHAVPMQ